MGDKNQIVGIVLIFLLVLGFQFFGPETTEEVDTSNAVTVQDTSAVTHKEIIKVDSLGDTTIVVDKTIPERVITIKNEDVTFKISSKGAKYFDFELSKYKIHDKTAQVVLLQEDKTSLGTYVGGENVTAESFNYKINSSSDKIVIGDQPKTIELVGTTKDGKTIKQSFTVPVKGYLIEHRISGDALAAHSEISYDFKNTLPVVERKFEHPKGYNFARQHATANYYTVEDEHDDIGQGATESEEIEESLKWFSFRQRFFTIGINPEVSMKDMKLTSDYTESVNDLDYIKHMEATYKVPLNNKKELNSKLYVGPNDYYTLEATGIKDFGENVDMGPLIFGLINKFAILPVFDFLSEMISNFGLVILLLVLIIKIVLFPIAYKSYSSMAKMKALKPDLDKLKEKHGDDQQAYGAAQMGLYRQAGVNPLSGCLPQVLQIPILFALFRFFPNAIQLRQESFLWAKDLSTFDALVHWDTWIMFIGTHISIFTILMTITTLVNSWYNSQFSANSSNNPAADQMKYLMYFMPLIFFFVLNDYPSGLTFYYFISTLFTIAQQFVANKMIDTDAIRAKIDTNVQNSANGTAKKSRFQQRMEAAMEAQNAAKKAKKK